MLMTSEIAIFRETGCCDVFCRREFISILKDKIGTISDGAPIESEDVRYCYVLRYRISENFWCRLN